MEYQLPADLRKTYTIRRLLHEGKNSAVYLVEHNRLHNLWAVKQARRQSAAEQDMRREYELLRTLRHPKLPFVSGIAEDENTICIIEEYIEGKTLQKDLAEGSGRSGQEMAQRAVLLGNELCGILSYLHGQEYPVIHRDLKPANIMLLPDGGIKLLDFGIAAVLSPDKPAPPSDGTPGYAAPEQLSEGAANVRTDIYALGVTLFETASGMSPSQTPYALPQLRTVNPGASPGLEHIISKCTQTDPADRYASVREVLYDLQNIDALKAPEETPGKARKGRGTLRRILPAAAAVLCAAAAFVWITNRQNTQDGPPASVTVESGAGESVQPPSAYEEGTSLLAQGYALEAAEKFSEILRNEPENTDALIGHGDAVLMAAQQSMASHIFTEEALLQRNEYYKTAQKDYEKAAELGNTEAESKLEALPSFLEKTAVDAEVLDAMEKTADAFESGDLEQACSLIAQSDAARTSYCNIHGVQSILFPVNDKAILSGWPWTYYGTVENELPSGEGIAVNQDRMMRVSLAANWAEGAAQGEAEEETVNLSPVSASGNFFVTRSRSGLMHDGVMEGAVTETLTYKISEEDEDGKITDFVTDPFEITYTVSSGIPEALDKSSLPEGVSWRNAARLESEDIYAFSETARLLFYVNDYQSNTYTIESP